VTVEILVGDARQRLAEIESGTVNTCVTSPPYFGLRDYGHEGQMGLEPTPDEFVAGMVEVFREVRRVLRDDGTLWLNIGDSYWTAKGASCGTDPKQGARRGWARPQDRPGRDGLKGKDLIGIPWMLAFALRADGWYLRQDIIWSKPNPMPESVRDRCTKAHEYVFLLSKRPRYYYDAETIAEESIYAPGKTKEVERVKGYYGGKGTDASRNDGAFKAIRPTRNKRSVWTVAPKPFKGAHFATFPPALIEPCVLAGAPVGGLVLDPFSGAGTTGVVALKHGRRATLIEINPEYAAMARERITDVEREIMIS
jgi:DNA modification methylase